MQREHHFRRLAGGIALIAAPVLYLASIAFIRTFTSDLDAQMAAVAASPTPYVVSGIFNLLFVIAMIGALLALMHLAREHRGMQSLVGGGIAIAGIATFGVWTGADAAMIEVLQAGEVTEAGALYDAITFSPAAIVAGVGSFLLVAGMITLAVALWRSQTVPAMYAGMLALAPLLMVGAYLFYSLALMWAGGIAFLLAMAPIGWHLLAETDEEWEHAPQWHGLSPTGA